MPIPASRLPSALPITAPINRLRSVPFIAYPGIDDVTSKSPRLMVHSQRSPWWGNANHGHWHFRLTRLGVCRLPSTNDTGFRGIDSGNYSGIWLARLHDIRSAVWPNDKHIAWLIACSQTRNIYRLCIVATAGNTRVRRALDRSISKRNRCAAARGQLNASVDF